MKPVDQAQMLEAMRLTQSGRLTDAVCILQRALGGATSGDAATPVVASPALTSPFIDGQIVAEAGSSPSAAAETCARRAPRLRAWSFPGSRLARAPQPSDIAPAAGRYISGSFSNGSGSRSYKLYIPSRKTGAHSPLIVMLHGCTQTADDFAAGTRMNFAAEAHGCYVVYPEQPQAANASKCWNWFRAGDQARDNGEPALIAGITRQVMREHNVDPGRVYVAGLSAGGAAAAIMGESYPDLYAAVGVHSGIACGAARDLPSAFAAMRGQAAINGIDMARVSGVLTPTIVFHGDGDTTVHPSNGAKVIERATAGNLLSGTTARKQTSAGQSFTHSVRQDAGGLPVLELWELHGAGHAWSGGSSAGSFTNPNGPNATQEMLRFFLTHRRAA
jgi:poly(hydroxyalkanoate) depolymerase family esterase